MELNDLLDAILSDGRVYRAYTHRDARTGQIELSLRFYKFYDQSDFIHEKIENTDDCAHWE